jgi:hypothetical protein
MAECEELPALSKGIDLVSRHYSEASLRAFVKQYVIKRQYRTTGYVFIF